MSTDSTARPNPLPAAALASLLVLLLGVTSLFALYRTNLKSAAALSRLAGLHAAQVAAVETQVSFKTQVQEWKNLLLRGREPADRKIYGERFARSAAEVQAGLAAVGSQLKDLGLDAAEVARLRTAHTTLDAAYGEALGRYDSADPSSTFMVDAAVRGIDRQLNEDIDALARFVERSAAAELAVVGEEAASRYETLRKITLGVGAGAMLAAFWLVFQVNRASRIRRG